MRYKLLLLSGVLLASPQRIEAQSPQIGWIISVPVELRNIAPIPSPNPPPRVVCMVLGVDLQGQEFSFGQATADVPLDANGNASQTVTLNVPVASKESPANAQTYKCELIISTSTSRCVFSATATPDECRIQIGSELVNVVRGSVR
jgi:hypothetical protein